jgi:hypothetical protein
MEHPPRKTSGFLIRKDVFFYRSMKLATPVKLFCVIEGLGFGARHATKGNISYCASQLLFYFKAHSRFSVFVPSLGPLLEI